MCRTGAGPTLARSVNLLAPSMPCFRATASGSLDPYRWLGTQGLVAIIALAAILRGTEYLALWLRHTVR